MQQSTFTPQIDKLLATAKWSFATRRVERKDAVQLKPQVEQAISGDLVLARVLRIGSHKRVQLTTGRPADLYPNDLIVAACGARYASDQFEGVARIDAEATDLLAGGGCLGHCRMRNQAKKPPTQVVPLGLLCDNTGQVINLQRYALRFPQTQSGIFNIGVVGTTMNSGKTTAVASLVNGLTRAGYQVAALKATGTGAFGDYNAYVDAGATFTADFTDTGMVSTYQQPLERITESLRQLIHAAHAHHCGISVIEFADGIFQQETAALLRDPEVRGLFGGFLFAVPDALSAFGGVTALRDMEIVPAALTGLLTQAPLNSREAETATGLPVLSREALRDPAQAAALLNSCPLDKTPQQRIAA